VLRRDEAFTVSVNPGVTDENRVMVLEAIDGRKMAVLTPALADRLDLPRRPDLGEPAFRRILDEASATPNGADHLFYFPEAGRNSLLRAGVSRDLRPLTAQDEAAFTAFEDAASKQDLDDAYVELDHRAVFGAFEQDRLVCVASMYHWEDRGSPTPASWRSRPSKARATRAKSSARSADMPMNRALSPNTDARSDNHASVALAKATGLAMFGKWEVVTPRLHELSGRGRTTAAPGSRCASFEVSGDVGLLRLCLGATRLQQAPMRSGRLFVSRCRDRTG
jgi:hypothetical protein